MPLSIIPAWKESPFLRLLSPFIAGIIIQWYLQFHAAWSWTLIVAASAGLLLLHTTQIHYRFKVRYLTGILLKILIVSCGAIVTWINHPNNGKHSINSKYIIGQPVKAIVQEPLSQKKNSYKTTASVQALLDNDRLIKASGNIIVYFSLAVDPREISYGSIIMINKPLYTVKSSGNPASFDYHRYATFHQTSFQVFLQPGEFSISKRSETRGLKKLIFYCRQQVIEVLRTYITGTQESALAEALLIGYKDELDKELVQAYSNTGVVHIIAVSGMHLGIIYWLLSLIVRPFRTRSAKYLIAIIILAGLWGFSLLAGAGPSVIRSAFMFSLIVVGETFSRRNNIYNNLACSAFLLLCWNPFWLWDVGFQLSYAAVLSIVLFFKPVYNLVFIRNKLLDALWKLNAVTLAAQVLTTPLSLYHFHQFPNCFLVANLLAVPLSSLLLVGEIVLCAVSFIPMLAQWTGSALNFLLHFLNNFIQNINSLPFASWTHLQLNIAQVILLYGLIAAITSWLAQKDKKALIVALCMSCLFIAIRTHSFMVASAQQKLIVYNVPKHRAIDFIDGRKYFFEGDSAVESDNLIRRFHLEPSRTLHRISPSASLPGLLGGEGFFLFHGKRVLIVAGQRAIQLPPGTRIDLLIVSQNPRLISGELLRSLNVSQVVADASNTNRFLTQWQKQCTDLNISFHSVVENGAYILKLS